MSPVSFRRKMIRSEQTLGERLAAARAAARLTLTEAEEATHVREKYLAALEADRFDCLPEEVYSLGFVRRYAQILGLDPHDLSRQFRTERLATLKRSGRAAVEPVQAVRPIRFEESKVVITPKVFWFATSLTLVLAVSGYLWYQVRGFLSAPNLDLASATPEMVVSTPSIEIKGQTDGTAFVTINAEPVPIDTDGSFTQEVRLEPGMNTIEVAAKNRLNKETKKQVKVLATYESGELQ